MRAPLAALSAPFASVKFNGEFAAAAAAACGRAAPPEGPLARRLPSAATSPRLGSIGSWQRGDTRQIILLISMPVCLAASAVREQLAKAAESLFVRGNRGEGIACWFCGCLGLAGCRACTEREGEMVSIWPLAFLERGCREAAAWVNPTPRSSLARAAQYSAQRTEKGRKQPKELNLPQPRVIQNKAFAQQHLRGRWFFFLPALRINL